MDITFQYNNNNFSLMINRDDPSGLGCIREIVHENEYSLHNFCNLEGSILDVGANCGVATIILAKQNPKATIYSYEPHLPTYKLLCENVKINGLTNVKTFNLALTNKSDETIYLYESPLCSGGNTTCSDDTSFAKHFNLSKAQSLAVKTISLDDIIIQNDIKQISLLKIDCEGAEFQIIPSSLFFKTRIVKNIVGEFHDLIYNTQINNSQINNTQINNSSEELIKYCREHVAGVVKISILKIIN